MIIGHYATALIPYSKCSHISLWFFLFIANFPDFLWLFLAILNIEAPIPSSMFEASFSNIQVEMTYSHDLIPVIILTCIISFFVFVYFRNKAVALWSAILVILHFFADFISGFHHHIFGIDSPTLGLGFYHANPYLAIFIESGFGAFFVLMFSKLERKQERFISRKKLFALYAIFIIGPLLYLPMAKTPLNVLFNF